VFPLRVCSVDSLMNVLMLFLSLKPYLDVDDFCRFGSVCSSLF